MKKKKNKKQKQEILSFPKQLQLEQYFSSPIWWADEPSFVNKLNKASDPYIEASKKNLKPAIDERNKKFGNKGDMGHVFHSTSLISDPNFKELQNYVGATANNLLNEMGFDLTNLGSSAYHIGHLKYSSNCNCFGKLIYMAILNSK